MLVSLPKPSWNTLVSYSTASCAGAGIDEKSQRSGGRLNDPKLRTIQELRIYGLSSKVTRNKKPSTERDKSQVEHALGEQEYLEFPAGLVGSRRRDEAEIGPFFSPNECDVLERVPMNGFVHAEVRVQA